MKKHHRPSGQFLSIGHLSLDTDARRLFGPDGDVVLVPSQFVLLKRLMQTAGVVVSTTDLIAANYADADHEPNDAEAAIRCRIMRLRAMIERVGCCGDMIRSLPGIGYVIEGPRLLLRAFTPHQIEVLDQIIATHPDPALVAQFDRQAIGQMT